MKLYALMRENSDDLARLIVSNEKLHQCRV